MPYDIRMILSGVTTYVMGGLGLVAAGAGLFGYIQTHRLETAEANYKTVQAYNAQMQADVERVTGINLELAEKAIEAQREAERLGNILVKRDDALTAFKTENANLKRKLDNAREQDPTLDAYLDQSIPVAARCMLVIASGATSEDC